MIDASVEDTVYKRELIQKWSINKKIQFPKMSIDFSKNDLLAA